MFPHAFAIVVAFTLLRTPTPLDAFHTLLKARTAPALDPADDLERPDAESLVREAKALWYMEKDYTGALAKFNAAVDADPEDNDARLQRGYFFEVLSVIAVQESRAEFKERAKDDYQHISDADPDSLVAGTARDGLKRLSGEAFFEPKPVDCPEAAAEIHARGDDLYGARRFADAIMEYEKATAGCPRAAAWWVDLADSHYVLGDYESAEQLFVKALAIDPWNREAHRFLANTELQLGDREAAMHQLTLTVVSDPSYEAGWSALQMYAAALGRKWNRVYGGRTAEPPSFERASWIAYRSAMASARASHGGSTSALAVERAAVKSALEVARQAEGSSPAGTRSFWSMMARAERSGFLDEAIFIHLLDAELAVEYPEFRRTNGTRLASYLETMLMQ